MKVIGVLVTAVVVAALNAVLNGWAFVTLWNWFVLPSFESAPVLTIPVAIGIGILISLLTIETPQKTQKTTTEESVTFIFASLLRPVMAVGMGWIVTLFI